VFALRALIRVNTAYMWFQRGGKHATHTTIKIEIRIPLHHAKDRMHRHGGLSMTPANKRSKKSNVNKQGKTMLPLCNETPLTQANILTIV